MRPMTTWHRLGDKPELLLQVPTVFKLDRWSVAVFHHDGRLRAIGNACNHKGGPLSEGRLHGEFVMCPWHAWEYSVITGKGPEGYDEEQVPVFAVEEREDGVYVQTPPVMPRRLVKHKPRDGQADGTRRAQSEHPARAGRDRGDDRMSRRWGYEDIWRDWYEAEDRVIVELRERSWLKSDPKDVMDQRTCCILKFRSDRISEIRDYTDSHIYEEYLKRHREELPKFKQYSHVRV